MPELDSEAIDFRAASESFAPFKRLRRADLETLHLLTRHQGRKVPTVAGMLLFGRERERHFTDACQDAGLAPPILEEIGTHFRVTLSTERVTAPARDEKDRAILDTLAGDEGRLTNEIARAIGLSTRATRTRLARLVERGLVREIGTSPQDPKRKYFRVE